MRRNLLVDALKICASQLIVFHHLATYGPISDVWDAAATASSDWFFEYGRMAVQVFLVIGGYLAAQGLERSGTLNSRTAARQIFQRYVRLALPLVAALALAIFSSMLARQWAHYQFFPAAPTWGQFWSHVLLIQTITGDKSLSAGVWYIAMDLQLFSLMTLLAWLGGKYFRAIAIVCTLASLFYFNVRTGWDDWGIYFLGAYGLGAAAWWCTTSPRSARATALLATAGVLTLTFDFRERIAVALCIALLLVWFHPMRDKAAHCVQRSSRLSALLHTLSISSYALFLVHFSMVMLGNALYAKWGLNSPLSAAVTIFACWATSMGLALLFERWIERPLQRVPAYMFRS